MNTHPRIRHRLCLTDIDSNLKLGRCWLAFINILVTCFWRFLVSKYELCSKNRTQPSLNQSNWRLFAKHVHVQFCLIDFSLIPSKGMFSYSHVVYCYPEYFNPILYFTLWLRCIDSHRHTRLFWTWLSRGAPLLDISISRSRNYYIANAVPLSWPGDWWPNIAMDSDTPHIQRFTYTRA